MDVYETAAALKPVLDSARRDGKTIGLVGTSGAMHDGHLSLIKRCHAENDLNVLFWGGKKAQHAWRTSTISYDRDAERDYKLAEDAGAQILYAPAGSEIFPRRPFTRVTLPEMSSGVPHLEDPAHLDLIALAMCKLWNMTWPERVYFGEKDWQQLVMFQRLASDLSYPIDVIGCPTIRDDDGLALSSRNAQLSQDERAEAPVLYRALRACQDAALSGTRETGALAELFGRCIGDPDKVRYFTAVVSDTMEPVDLLAGSVRILASIQLGSIRILDNIGLQI
jgi:pantoate--beta-alanine ligase